MYSTCLFCRHDLGANEMIEHFPVGKRLAFDAARGRLWVVCPSCRQWCLSPLDERWEAIEEAERTYRDARLRATTGEIGLARLRDGSELIRIGEPLRPEMAAWRYGARFGARWRKQATLVLGVSALVGGYIVAGPIMGLLAGGVGAVPWNLANFARSFVYGRRIVARFERTRGTIVVTHAHVRGASIAVAPDRPEGWVLRLPHFAEDRRIGALARRSARASDPWVELAGAEALATARAILPVVNAWGGRRRTVEDAVRILEGAPSGETSFQRVARNPWSSRPRVIAGLDAPERLALEMAAHEETERRAFDGELADLEAAWREAEVVAAIADDLTIPERVLSRLADLKR